MPSERTSSRRRAAGGERVHAPPWPHSKGAALVAPNCSEHELTPMEAATTTEGTVQSDHSPNPSLPEGTLAMHNR